MRLLEPKKINKYIRQIADGDIDAIESLYEYTVRNMRHIAKYYLVNESSVDDMIVQLYASVLKGVNSFSNDKNGYNWMFTILRNQCKRENIREYQFDVIQLEMYDIEDDSFQPLKSLAVAEAIEELNDKEKKVIYMIFWEGYTVKEIAAMEDMPLATVYTLQARALQKMKKIFK